MRRPAHFSASFGTVSYTHLCDIRVSQYPFLGGTRAVIASKNILIDNSFETKLKEAEQDFQFSL